MSAQISINPGSLSGVDVTPPSEGCSVVKIYDSEDSSLSGKLVLAEFHVDAGHISLNHEYFSAVAVNRGIYAEVTNVSVGASTPSYVVRYGIG